MVLASGSERRRELLTLVGAHFECRPVRIDETPLPMERAEGYVLRLAEAKARAALAAGAAKEEPGRFAVLGADTAVTIDRDILGKPAAPEEAARMLARLSGRVHEVWTGLSLLDPVDGRAVTRAVRSIVKFSRLDDEEIGRYVATGEPLDKAGAYAVQGRGALYVEAIEGSYSNVVGLPLSHLKQALRLLCEAPRRAS
ncbi:MAG: septum formation inhibitor Maf [Candidatus Latescibacteria bacterium]|nr:septum formation inhibitor Maf [Candidatus Latescibacterota bacterium]